MSGRPELEVDASAFRQAADVLGRFEAVAGKRTEEAERAAGEKIRDRVRSEARRHRRTGRLEAQITENVTGRGLGAEVKVRSGGRVAGLVQVGTRPHAIEPVRRHALALQGPSGFVAIAAHVQHPGTRGDPYFRRGVDAARGDVKRETDQAIDAIARDLADDMKRRA